MNPINVVPDLYPFDLIEGGAFYVEAEKLCAQYYRGNDILSVTDLTNAQKPGAQCLHVHFEDVERDSCELLNLVHKSARLSELLDQIRERMPADGSEYNGVFKKDASEKGVQVTAYYRPAKRIFSPWAPLKPLTERPAKWTLAHVRRALLNGQAEPVCSMELTDDYFHDAQVNCRKGVKPGALALCEDLTSSPSGWWVGDSSVPGGISVNCHSFLYYDLHLSI